MGQVGWGWLHAYDSTQHAVKRQPTTRPNLI